MINFEIQNDGMVIKDSLYYNTILNYILDENLKFRVYKSKFIVDENLTNVTDVSIIANFCCKFMIEFLLPALKSHKIEIENFHLTPREFSNLAILYGCGYLTKSFMIELIDLIVEYKLSIGDVIQMCFYEIWKAIESQSKVDQVIKNVLESNSDKVESYRNGNEKLLGFFVGQAMKDLKGIEGSVVKSKIIEAIK